MLKQFSSLFVSLPATTVGAVAAVGAVTLASAGWSSIDPPPQRWQLGEVVVEDERAPALAEQDLVGAVAGGRQCGRGGLEQLPVARRR